MPISGYGVLKGRPIDSIQGEGRDPHYQIRVVDQTTHYRIAINIKSQESPSDLSYLIQDGFRHPVLEELAKLAPGFHALASQPNGLALDFIRDNLFPHEDMTALPFGVATPAQLDTRLDFWVQRALRNEEAMLYAFGQRWGPETNKADQYFGFLPGNGVHDMHMNQGNDGRFTKDDGVWQDGALLLQFPDPTEATGLRWLGVFLKFQSQPWHTDDRTGHALVAPPSEAVQAAPPDLAAGEAARRVRIVAARLIADAGAPETVTLLNASPEPVALDGWAIANRKKNKAKLSGTIAAGGAKVIDLPADVTLSHQGDIITLLDAQGLKVHGVSYTRNQARRKNWTLVF